MKEWIAFAAALAILGVGLVTCAACRPAESPLPEYCYDDDKFVAAVAGCASTAPTKAASQQCRKVVHAACGIAYTVADGGEP